jgi:SAM-dependent methyltransferase
VNPVERLHEGYIKQRRVRALASSFAPLIPQNATVLDVGCGDGAIAAALIEQRPTLNIQGLDVSRRADARIPVSLFDGRHVPFPDAGFDVVLFSDVLHHTSHAEALLREGRRVARDAVVVKDHCADGALARPTLRFMDRVGNARFDVALPHLYLTWAEWQRMFARLELTPASVERRLGLYPPPLSWVFERSLHFVARLVRESSQ